MLDVQKKRTAAIWDSPLNARGFSSGETRTDIIKTNFQYVLDFVKRGSWTWGTEY